MRASDVSEDSAGRVAWPALPDLDAYRQALEAVWEDGWVSNFGPAARRLEALCAAYTGLGLVRSVSNADTGLILAIAALELPPGAPVLVPSFTFPSTLHAVLWNGLEPVFADVDPRSWCLTAESVAPALDRRPRAIVGTHAFLACCDVAGLEAVAASAGAALVFDAAQAFASWIGDTHVGAFGDASVFSFSATKVVTSAEGGLAAFRSPAVADRFERLRSYGMGADDEVGAPGLNGKLSELHATLGCLTVPDVEAEVEARGELVHRYRARLEGRRGVRMQRLAGDLRPTPTQLVVDLGDRRDAAARALAARGIATRTYFRPLHEMPRYARLAAAPLPVTERLGRSLLTLPLHARLTAGAVDRVCDVVVAVTG
jgi:dTDP-4-amino-4,6-dideoxygalactose transaminase